MAFAKGVYVQDVDGNQTVEGVFLVQSRQAGTTRKGDPFLKLKLSDRTGMLEARVWSNTPAIAVRFNQGDFVFLHARSEVYQGTVQVNVIDLTVVPDEQVDLSDYLPATRFDIDALEAQLRGLIESCVRSPWVRTFLMNVLDDGVVRPRFRIAPAATVNHHNYIGGLLEHVLSMARLALGVARHYERYYPGAVDADLLLAGVVLHDIGKITELSYDREFSYTEEGELIGHLVTGVGLVQRIAETIPGFPTDLTLKLQHLVVSHHGKLEFGSPKRPRIIEAVLLHEIDIIDSRMNAFASLLSNRVAEESSEEPAHGSWSEYSRMFEAKMLLPPEEGYAWASKTTLAPNDLLGPGLAAQDLAASGQPAPRANGRVEQAQRSLAQLNLLE